MFHYVCLFVVSYWHAIIPIIIMIVTASIIIVINYNVYTGMYILIASLSSQHVKTVRSGITYITYLSYHVLISHTSSALPNTSYFIRLFLTSYCSVPGTPYKWNFIRLVFFFPIICRDFQEIVFFFSIIFHDTYFGGGSKTHVKIVSGQLFREFAIEETPRQIEHSPQKIGKRHCTTQFYRKVL